MAVMYEWRLDDAFNDQRREEATLQLGNIFDELNYEAVELSFFWVEGATARHQLEDGHLKWTLLHVISGSA
jgi:hypothetical protein